MSDASILLAERSILSSNWLISKSDLSPAYLLAKQAANAEYQSILSSELAAKVLALQPASSSSDDDAQFQLEKRLVVSRSVPEGLEMTQEEWELAVLSVAVALLQSFVQLNWTGPSIPLSSLDIFPSSSFDSEVTAQDLDNSATSALSYLGEPAYHLSQNPTFIRLALILFSSFSAFSSSKLESAPWWSLRATRAHHQVLILTSPLPLPESIIPSAADLLTSSRLLPNDSTQRDLRAKLSLEIGLTYHLLLGADKEAGAWFVKAAKDESELEWELTGAMGRRTKFQQNDIGQLVVVARGRERDGWVPAKSSEEVGLEGGADEKPVESKPEAAQQTNQVPETLALNDDTLLEQTLFTSSGAPHPTTPATSLLQSIDPANHPPLHPLDQAHLLSFPLTQANLPSSTIATSQLTPFTALVLGSPQNWSIHTTALLLRSRAEAHRTRTVERSVLQLQALVDQIPLNEDGNAKGIANAKERLRYFWDLVVPSKWDLEKELAERLVSIGVLRSALEIYERLEMWNQVVQCYQELEQPEKALSIVESLLSGKLVEEARTIHLARTGPAAPSERHRTRMSVARKSNLLCMLGDLLPDRKLELYKQAWEESNKTSSRAARSIAGTLFATQQFADSIPYFEAALAINPLFSRSWFILGCAYVKSEDWKDAVRCFRRVVAIEEDDAEGWANLASCYLRMGDVGGLDGLQKEAAGVVNDDGLDVEEEEVVRKETQDDTPNALTETPRIPHANKILAHRALKIGLKYGHENWRMWSNYLLVCIDLGENSEACRALTRVVEERASRDGEDCIDMEVLDRLVGAVTARPPPGSEAAKDEPHSPNEGAGLHHPLARLFDQVILPRLSDSSRIYKSHARLLLWEGRFADALDANVKAYRASVVNDEQVERKKERWQEAVEETRDVVDTLIALGPKAVEEEEKKLAEGEKSTWKDWKFQARSIVRSFMGRTKDSFEDEPEWDSLKEILEDIKSA